MRKKATVLILSTVLFALFPSPDAQQPKTVPRIGYLSNSDPATESTRSEAIRLALCDLGYIEGQNIAIEYRYGEGKRDRDFELAAELVRLKVDIIVVAGGASWVRAAKSATKTTPIVMVGSGDDPVEAGLVESLARPGGNVTGVSFFSNKLEAKRLGLLHELVPSATVIAYLIDPNFPDAASQMQDVREAARALRLQIMSRTPAPNVTLIRS